MAKDTFENKLEELNKLILDIESGKDGLNISIDKYAKAKELASELAEILGEAKQSLGLGDHGESGEEGKEE